MMWILMHSNCIHWVYDFLDFELEVECISFYAYNDDITSDLEKIKTYLSFDKSISKELKIIFAKIYCMIQINKTKLDINQKKNIRIMKYVRIESITFYSRY